jgi:hypothetical protein
MAVSDDSGCHESRNFLLAPASSAMLASSPPMRIAVSLAAGLAILAGVLHAQSDDDEDEMDYFPLVPSGNHVRFGLHFIGGPKVAFGQLGIVPSSVSSGDATGVMSRTYNDGYVVLDLRKDTNGNPVGDGLTNNWSFKDSSQATAGGDLAFHDFSTTTLGASESAKRSNAAGWELQIGRRLGKIGRKVDFSLVGAFGFTNINAKASGVVQGLLTTVTDVYPLYGQDIPSVPYTAPTYGSQYVYDANGNQVLDVNGNATTTSVETSTLLGNQPNRTTTTSVADVKGYWHIKGAYYTFKVGPMLQFPITERLKFSVGAGAALALIGTNFIVDETLELNDVNNTTLETTQEQSRFVMLPLYYAEADAEYWLTERSGFYFGANYQKSGSYDQSIGGRTATINLGTTSGVQGGITLRF